MKRRSPNQRSLPKTAKPAKPTPQDAVSTTTVATTPSTSDQPPPWFARILSVGISVHLVAIALSYTAVVSPSSFHRGLLGFVEPYLQLFHFGADDRPVYLAHGAPTEQPHRIEWSRSTSPRPDEWEAWDVKAQPGLAAQDRIARFTAALATLAETEQPSLIAEMLLPIVQQNKLVNQIRIRRLPTELTTVVDDAAPPPYVARVVRSGDAVRLVQLYEERLVTQPLDEVTE